ncbi:MAG: hypothetical protein REJ50_17150, partial [Bordetella sp.]|nr:hypothetical protein [Bordetella sp.]
APVAGFLKYVAVDEGDKVTYGSLLARMEIPDLESRLAQKKAETCEVEAKVRLLLKAGANPRGMQGYAVGR